MPLRNEKGRFRAATASEKGVDIRTLADIPKLDAMFRSGATTFVLIYADWCGHCHRYLPTWSDLESTPGRTANMARVHHDMQEKIPAVAKANIEGYPSVVKVLPSGKLEEYNVGDSNTNAIPEMRDEDVMKRNLTDSSNYSPPPANKGEPGPQVGMVQSGGAQAGGSVLNAFLGALQQAGPAALLLAAYSTLPKSTASYRGPKRQSRRASSRHVKRTRRLRRLRN